MSKILIIPSWYHSPGEIGGHFISTQSKALFRRGIDITVFHNNLNRTFSSGIRKGVIQLDYPFPFYQLNGYFPPRWSDFMFDIWCKSGLRYIKSIVDKDGIPDVVHGHSYIGGYLARSVALMYHIPYIVTEHFNGFLDGGTISRRHQNIAKKTFLDANEITAVSSALAMAIAKRYDLKEVSIIPNMVDTNIFTLPASKNGRDFTFVTIGFNSSNKNFELIISAFAKWQEEVQICGELLIIGDVVNMSNLHRLVKMLGIEKSVKFKGILHEKDVARYLQCADVYISASGRETFGLAIAEAMSCGLPVITNQSGGPEEFVDGECGIIISNLQVHTLKEAMRKMHYDLKTYDKNLIREKIVKRFSFRPFVEAWRGKYDSTRASFQKSKNLT